MKKFLFLAALSLILIGSSAVYAAGPKSELSIDTEGRVTIKNARIIQVAGKSFFARAEWNDIFLRVLIRTDDKTKISKRFKGSALYADIQEGHYLNVEGRLNTSSDTFDIVASSIQDLSLESDTGKFSGTISAINIPANTFTLATKEEGKITVSLAGATITKGSLMLKPDLLRVGDKVLAAVGSYTFPTKTLAAAGITIFQDPAQFISKTYVGKLISVQGTSLPTTLSVAIDGRDYVVQLSTTTEILNTAKKHVLLSRFLTGDPIRIYGKKVESLSNIIEAEVVRNINI